MSDNQATSDKVRQLRAILGDMGAAILDTLVAHQTTLRILTALWVIAALVAVIVTVAK